MKLLKVHDGVGIKEIHWDLDRDVSIDEFEVVPIGDTHIGSPVCNLEEIKRVVKYVQEGEDRYAILMGDFIDNGIPGSKTDTLTQTMTMQEQVDLAVELFEPIKDKILCILSGNHEERTRRVVGIDPSSFMAFKLGLEEVYSAGTGIAFIDLKFGKGKRSSVKNASHHFTVAAAHGARSGTTIGSAAKGLEGLQNIIVNADLYIVGHTHKTVNFIKETYFVNNYGNLETKIQYYVNTTAFLNYGDYGKDKLYPPTSIKPQSVHISVSERRKIRGRDVNRTKQYFICNVLNI